MAIERIQLLRSIGQFDNDSTGAQLQFTPLTIVYAENGRGKTTIATLLRAASTGDAKQVNERQRLGSTLTPKIVIGFSGQTTLFDNGAWAGTIPQIAVFDDAFVAANICSGIEIDPAHRQNLHELILGSQGVALNAALQGHVGRIEQHNQALRQYEAAIGQAARGALSVDAFCALPPELNIEALITASQNRLMAARSSDDIRRHDTFLPIILPQFDVAALNEILGRSLPDLAAQAAARVRGHVQSLGPDGETWLADGIERIVRGPENQEFCPFCSQDLATSPLIDHYQAYFSQAYEDLKSAISQAGQSIQRTHAGDMPAAFERSFRIISQTREFWRAFTIIPELDVDTASIVRDWNAARESVLAVLRGKAATPLDACVIPPESLDLINAYHAQRQILNELIASLTTTNVAIALLKEQAATANVATAETDLLRLKSIQTRYSEPLAAACHAYLNEKAAKVATEAARSQAREALDNYRQHVFPAYETTINDYLRRFNASFRLGSVGSVNTRAGSSATYSVVINNVAVSLTTDAGPSFRTTLSAGDRNTLALAFFFASLDQSTDIAQKIVVIDDPMTSLDEHRSLTTVQEIRLLQARVEQVIVLSHSKPFLCALWEGANQNARSAYLLQRATAGSALAVWDVHQDCITEHDRRHARVRGYLRQGNATEQRQVAADLRHILECYARVAYPEFFWPGQLLGPFYGLCLQRVGTAQEILSQIDTTELRALLDYANQFHHDTNLAWQTVAINDQELVNNCQRILAFTQRQ